MKAHSSANAENLTLKRSGVFRNLIISLPWPVDDYTYAHAWHLGKRQG
ncbi:hypothetical protein IIA29_04330 [candidate division KSB1 bacterium]|nr:hypothetical protein [candidate division KSB1 bacterium]